MRAWEVVSSVREIGMSTRAIASATGNSKNTITEDFRQLSQSGTPDPAPVTGVDGKTYTPRPRPEPTPAPESSPEPAPRFDDEPATPEWEDVGTIPAPPQSK